MERLALIPRWLWVYLIVMSVVAAIVTVFDKISAKLGGRRVPETTLMTLAALGGSAAMLAVMLLIRHKTRHPKFMLGIPLIIIIQLAAAAALLR